MAPPPAVAAAADPAAPIAAAPIVPADPKTNSILEPLLVYRDALLRSHRKATCWLFFREVAVRPASDNERTLETCLACRLCRPDVISLDRWDAVKGNRNGLVRYSSTKGTAAMRTHVKNAHLKEIVAMDRALAMANSAGVGGATDAAVGRALSVSAGETGETGVNAQGKRSLDEGAASAACDCAAKKQARENAMADIVNVVKDMEVAIASLHASLDGVKRYLDSM